MRLFCILLLMSCLFACTQEQPAKLEFKVKYQAKIGQCEQLGKLMWFVSNFSAQSDILLQQGDFSNEQVALIGANCNAQAWQIVLQQAPEAGSALSFDLAVPFELNHQNPLTAERPLNVSEMFWSWQLGHKFLRFDGDERFAFHLGSTGCKSPSRLRAPNTQCTHPNRFRFTVDNFDISKPITFDLDKLLDDVEQSRSCMSEQDSPVCQQLFSNLKQPLFYQE